MSSILLFDQMALSGQAITAAGNVLSVNNSVVCPKPLGFSTDGAGNPIVSGIKGYVTSPYTGVLSSWTLVADQPGFLTVDVYKIASGSVAPTATIIGAGGVYPALTGNQIGYSSSLSSWSNTSVFLGDIIGWVVSGNPSLVTRITFQMTIV